MYKRHESNATAASLEKVLQSHLFHDILERINGAVLKRGERLRTVLATIMENSSKLSLPSPSLSASIIVLSTISWSCVS